MNRRYEDYKKLGQHIRETYQSIYEWDIYCANEALKKAIEKATAMWDETSEMQTSITDLRDLQQYYLQPCVEKQSARSPEDARFVAQALLDETRYKFHQAFLGDIETQEVLVQRDEPEMGSSYPLLLSEIDGSQMYECRLAQR